jgi:hypothetical protein
MITFPPYVFHEFPKALYHPIDKEMVIVADREEEERVLSSWEAKPVKRKGGRPRKNP